MNPPPVKPRTFKICNLLAGMVLCFTATTSPAANPDTLGLVPLPAAVHRTEGAFKLQTKIRIVADATAHDSGEYLAAYLRTATGLPVQVESTSDPASKHGGIFLMTRPAQNNLGKESYRLAVGKDEVRIEAPAAAGIFYGVQTLLQLLPPQAFSSRQAGGVTWTIPSSASTRARRMWQAVSQHDPRASANLSLVSCLRRYKVSSTLDAAFGAKQAQSGTATTGEGQRACGGKANAGGCRPSLAISR